MQRTLILLFAGGMTIYILIGAWLEERDLADHFDEDYQRYQQQLSKLVPVPGRAWRPVSGHDMGDEGERADGAYSQQLTLKRLRSDRPVPGDGEALARERERLCILDHPNIARFVEGGEFGEGMLWFAMDPVDGLTIDRHAQSLPLDERLELICTPCRAVHHARRRSLIHGDIKLPQRLGRRARPCRSPTRSSRPVRNAKRPGARLGAFAVRPNPRGAGGLACLAAAHAGPRPADRRGGR